MASIEAFFALTAGKLPSCPDVLLREAIRDAAIRFCIQTRLIADQVDVDITPGDRYADLTPPEGVVYRVDAVRRDLQELEPLSRFEFERQGLSVTTGYPVAYYLEGDNRLFFGPVPEAPETLLASVVVRPADNATAVPDALYSDWQEAITAGARVYIRRNYQPWADVKAEADDRMLFDQAVNEANHKRARGGTNRALRVRGYFF